jgi:hypothetical protein
MGRPPIGAVAMSGAERTRLYRLKRSAAAPVTKLVTEHRADDGAELQQARSRIAELEAEATALKARAAQVPAGPVTNEPCEAQEPRELTSDEQDQILNLMLRLVMSVDHPHRKKFYKHFVANSKPTGGVFLSSCSHRGWKNGGFGIDDQLLTRLWAAFKREGCVFRVARPSPAG